MSLQGDKEITEDCLKQWVAYLKKKGFDRTINLDISSFNGLLRLTRLKSFLMYIVDKVDSNYKDTEKNKPEFKLK